MCKAHQSKVLPENVQNASPFLVTCAQRDAAKAPLRDVRLAVYVTPGSQVAVGVPAVAVVFGHWRGAKGTAGRGEGKKRRPQVGCRLSHLRGTPPPPQYFWQSGCKPLQKDGLVWGSRGNLWPGGGGGGGRTAKPAPYQSGVETPSCSAPRANSSTGRRWRRTAAFLDKPRHCRGCILRGSGEGPGSHVHGLRRGFARVACTSQRRNSHRPPSPRLQHTRPGEAVHVSRGPI